MKKYLFKRLLTIFFLMWLITVIIFVLLNVSDAGIERVFKIYNMSPFEIAREKSIHKIDLSPASQYFAWLGQVLRGNFGNVGGNQYSSGYSVSKLIIPKIERSIGLLFAGIFLAVLLGFILGSFSALKPKSIFSRAINTFTLVGISIPNFAVGVVLIILFAVRLKWLPSSGYGGLLFDPSPLEKFLDRFNHLLLPSFTLAFTYIATFTEHFSSSLKGVLNEDYIRTARSKGLPEWKVILKHALRNSVIPVLAKIFASLPFFIGGLVVVERVFSLPGIGSYIYENIVQKGVSSGGDFYVVLIIVGCSAVLALLGSLIADFIYVLIDPRVKNPVTQKEKKFNLPGFLGLIIVCVLILVLYHWRLYIVMEKIRAFFMPGIALAVILFVTGLIIKILSPSRENDIYSGFSFKFNFHIDIKKWNFTFKSFSKPAVVAAVIVLLLIFLSPYFAALCGITSEQDIPFDVKRRYQPPAKEIIMGTDDQGRSIFLLLVIFADDTLKSVFYMTVIGLIGGTLLGILMGYFQGVFDKLMMSIFDLISAVPSFFLVFIAIGMAGNSLKIIIPVTSVLGLIEFAKVVRARVLVIREMEFILAAKALGNTHIQLIVNHLFRNLLPLMWQQGILLFGRNMIFLSSLGFLQLLPPVTWGNLIKAGSGAFYRWWLNIFPITLIFIVVLAINTIGKQINKNLDPFES